jgi:hypothetical protein
MRASADASKPMTGKFERSVPLRFDLLRHRKNHSFQCPANYKLDMNADFGFAAAPQSVYLSGSAA